MVKAGPRAEVQRSIRTLAACIGHAFLPKQGSRVLGERHGHDQGNRQGSGRLVSDGVAGAQFRPDAVGHPKNPAGDHRNRRGVEVRDAAGAQPRLSAGTRQSGAGALPAA